MENVFRLTLSLICVLLLIISCEKEPQFALSSTKQNSDRPKEIDEVSLKASGTYYEHTDLNSDGTLDYVYVYSNSGTCKVIILTKNGNYITTFQSAYFQYYKYNDYTKIYDVNGDGYKDFIGIEGPHCYVVPGSSQNTFIFNNNARRYMNSTYFTYPYRLIKDINNDGYLDYLGISGTHCYVVPGNSTGQFDSTKRQYMNQIYFAYPNKTVVDMNADGYLDFVASSGRHHYMVPGTASGAFDHSKRVYSNY